MESCQPSFSRCDAGPLCSQGGTNREITMTPRKFLFTSALALSCASMAQGETFRLGTNGDLYLVISVKSQSLFERRNDNLYVEVVVPLAIAILGGEIQIPSPQGKLHLTIPPETQNGCVFRLAGQGMPHLGKSSRGKMLAKVKIVLPTKLSSEEKELFKQLSALRPNN